VQFSVPGDDTWREGKLVLENESLYFCSKEEPKHFFTRFLFFRKGEKIHNIVPVDRIRDVIREKSDRLTIKYSSTAQSPAREQGSPPEQLLSTHLSTAEHVLNEVERELVLRMDAYKFAIYFTTMKAADLLSMEKDFELEKGLLKIASEALWIIGRESLKRIPGEDIVHVEQKKRSAAQDTEYGAISIEYLDERSAYTNVLSTLAIAKGNTIEVLLRAALELMNAYKLKEKLSKMENRILTMMYTGALDIAPSGLASAAQATGLREEELRNHLQHLSKLGIIDLANERLVKKGIKYAIALSKKSTSGG